MSLNVSSTVKEYFEGSTSPNSITTLPHVSAEFNYNLVYSPYATFGGIGTEISAFSAYSPSIWTTQNYTQVSTSSIVKNTSSMKQPLSVQISVNANGDLTNDLNFYGSASLPISLGYTDSKCYKVVFYTKSINDSLIDLSVNTTSSSNTFGGSYSQEVDNIEWTRFEIKIGQRITDNPINSFTLNFNMANSTYGPQNTGQWGVLISNIRIFEISNFDYEYGNLWDTNSVFTWFRPGESYVRSGNSSILDSEVLTQRTISEIPAGWNNQAPCSSVSYSPRIIFGSNQNPIFKNGLLSPYSNYKYYVSENPSNVSNGKVGITGIYPELIDTNKIVLKFNISQSKPDNIIVYVKNSLIPDNNLTINISSSDINAAGVCILYWNGTTFTTNKWNWNPNSNSGMPYIDNTGNIRLYNGTETVNGYYTIDTISVVQTSATPIANFTNNSSISQSTLNEMKRLQIIEVSPRLEVDLSSFVMDVDIKKEFDNKDTPLPVSSISANSATIDFSNIPLSGTNNAPKSIFSTIANKPDPTKYPSAEANYLPPLAGLLVKNVKLYLSFYTPTIENAIIPGGVYYVDSWDNADIKLTKANCFDILKVLQTLPVTDYVSEGQPIQNIMSNVMDLSGFTDYNYDDIVNSVTDNSQKINTSFFYADSTNKTVYQSLQEMLVAFQIGAWVDEYGVLRFKNLSKILTDTTPDVYLNNNNVIVDTYNENIKTKIGKVLMKYRGPQVKRSLTTQSDTRKIVSIFEQAPDVIWQQDSEDVVPFNVLSSSIKNASQNYYSVSPSSFNSPFFSSPIDHQGYCIVENEIMSTGNQEILLQATNANGSLIATNATSLIYPQNSNDLTTQLAIFSNATNSLNIVQNPTGNYMDVKRGLFGTIAKPHLVMTNDVAGYSSVYANNFSTFNRNVTFSLANPLGVDKTGLISVPTSINYGTYVIPRMLDDNYTTYSAKFRFPDAKVDQVSAGLVFGLNTGSSSFYRIEITRSISNSGYKYSLAILKSNSSNSNDQAYITKKIDITSQINFDLNSNQPDDALFNSLFGNTINVKFVNGGPGKREIWINKKRYQLDAQPVANSKITTSSLWSPNYNPASFPYNFAGSQFGFYSFIAGGNSTSTTVLLSEIYATEYAVNDSSYYYFQTKDYLDKIVSGNNMSEKSFFVQAQPQIFGLNVYDVQLALSPSLGAEFFKVAYSLPYYPNNSGNVNPKIVNIYEDSLGYSEILSTGFRAKFAIVNKSNFAISTKSTISNSAFANAQLLVSSRSPILLTPQKTLEKIINPQLISEVVEIDSDWVQSGESADSILKIVSLSSDPFSKDIVINIFGDPLLQIGDVVQLTYNLKNIYDITFFVAGVEQNWSNGGLITTLILNQLTYNGTTRASYDNYYPLKQNLSGPSISSLSLKTGSDAGGDTVIITGSNFGINPVVFFGVNRATVVSSSSYSISVQTPAASTIGVVDVSVVSSNIVSKTNNNTKFTYFHAGPVVATVSSFAASVGTYSTISKGYPVTFNWTVDNTNGSNYNAYTLSVSDSDGNIILESDNVSDTNLTDNITTDGIFLPATNYNATFTPVYIDSKNVVYQGTSKSTTFKTNQVESLLPQPPQVITTTVNIDPSDSSKRQVIFNVKLGTNSDKTILYYKPALSSTAITAVVNGSAYQSGSLVTVSGLNPGVVSFTLYGYNSTTGVVSSTGYSVNPFDITSPSVSSSANTINAPTGNINNSIAAPNIINSYYYATTGRIIVYIDKLDPNVSSYAFYINGNFISGYPSSVITYSSPSSSDAPPAGYGIETPQSQIINFSTTYSIKIVPILQYTSSYGPTSNTVSVTTPALSYSCGFDPSTNIIWWKAPNPGDWNSFYINVQQAGNSPVYSFAYHYNGTSWYQASDNGPVTFSTISSGGLWQDKRFATGGSQHGAFPDSNNKNPVTIMMHGTTSSSTLGPESPGILGPVPS